MSEKNSFEELRRSLKKWEAAFVIVHQRKPNKDDLSNAPFDIKEKYRLYHEEKKGLQPKLKKSAESSVTEHLEQSEVWGVELNKKQQKHQNCPGEQSRKSVGDVLGKLGAKLFDNAKASHMAPFAMKKKPHGIFKKVPCNESLPESCAKKSSPPCSPSKPIPPSNAHEISNYGATSKETSNRTYTDVKDSDLVVRGGIFKGAERFLKKTASGSLAHGLSPRPQPSSKPRMSFLSRDFTKMNTENSDGDYEMDEITERKANKMTTVERSGSNFATSCSPQKIKTCNISAKQNSKETIMNPVYSEPSASPGVAANYCPGEIKDHLDMFETHKKPHSSVSSYDPDKRSPNSKKTCSNQTSLPLMSAHVDTFDFSRKHDETLFSKKLSNKSLHVNENKFSEGENANSRLGQAYASNLLKLDAEDQPLSAVSRKRKAVISDTDEETGDQEMQQPEKIRSKCDLELPNKSTVMKKAVLTKNTPLVKKSTAALSENFVSLNMKKKGYRRKGAAGLTAGQLRRKQWKQKMSSRSASYGTNKCFKCGGEGHWANKCKGKSFNKPGFEAPSSNTDVSGPVDETDFPSLRQAALMARGTDKVILDGTEHDETDITDIEASLVRDRWEDAATSSSQTPPAAKPLSSILDTQRVARILLRHRSSKPLSLLSIL
ncbi:ATP-dependent DNA helicase Q4-like, partial [Elysia marginata]